MNAKVRERITDIARTLTPQEIAQVASLADISSIQAISSLPPSLQQAVRDAFREGVRWAFISLVPWTALTAILVLFLSKIPDSDLARRFPSRSAPSGDTGKGENVASGDNTSNPEQQQREEKPRIYGPISLIIYLVKKQLKKRRETQARKRAAEEAAAVAA